MRIWIVIVNWNGSAFLPALLDSVNRLTKPGISLETLVVDNASDDRSVLMLREKYPRVRVLALDRNFGFAKGNNEGITLALREKADYIWLLNNDTTVAPDSLRALVKCLEDPDAGAASSKIYFTKGREYHHDRYGKKDLGRVIWYAGGVINWNDVYAFHRGVDEVDSGQYDLNTETGFLTGCSLMVKSGVIRKTGLFDERYYMYLEDVDLSLRIVASGYKIRFCPGSVVWHDNAASSGGAGSMFSQYYLIRNRILFAMRHAPPRAKLAVFRESVRKLLAGNPVEKKAVADAFRHRFGKKV